MDHQPMPATTRAWFAQLTRRAGRWPARRGAPHTRSAAAQEQEEYDESNEIHGGRLQSSINSNPEYDHWFMGRSIDDGVIVSWFDCFEYQSSNSVCSRSSGLFMFFSLSTCFFFSLYYYVFEGWSRRIKHWHMNHEQRTASSTRCSHAVGQIHGSLANITSFGVHNQCHSMPSAP